MTPDLHCINKNCYTFHNYKHLVNNGLVHSDLPTQVTMWSRAQEPSSETVAFVMPDLLHGTVSQASFTMWLTVIYLNATSKN